jgi:acetolactate synthase I/II/III large subunit
VLVAAVADAFLDRAPLVALTGQSDIERMHKESHQYIDLIGIMQPIVKWNARVASPEIIPSLIVVPIAYSIDVAISGTLGAETVAT